MSGDSRIGTTNKNTQGSLMVVVKYNNANDVWVKFPKQGNLVHTRWGCFLKGVVKNPYDRTLYGVGFQGISKTLDNKNTDKQYMVWRSMYQRCYDEKYHKKYPTYKNCYVADEWHNFQNFINWYDKNHYKIKGEKIALDKDILVKGNKVYSPETCIFVPQTVNKLFVRHHSNRGKLPIGVTLERSTNKYVAQCGGGSVRPEYLGIYNSPEDAFFAYKVYKEKYIKQIANEYKNKIPNRLYEALISYVVEIDD